MTKSTEPNEEFYKEGTEVVVGAQEIIERNLECLSDTIHEWNNYTDSIGPIIFSKVEEVKKAYAEALKRGVRIRIITEITKDNIDHCREGMKYVSELRHMDGISGTFVVSDKHYLSNAMSENIGSFQCVHSNIRSFVEQQKHIFENLWSNAIPATEKIKELEDVSVGFYKVLHCQEQARSLFLDLIESSRQEILILFSLSDRLLEYVHSGMIELLVNVIMEKKVQARILLPVDIQNYSNIRLKKRLETDLNDKEHLQKDKIKNGVAARKGKLTLKALDKNYKNQYLKKTSFILIVDSKVSMIGATSKDQENAKEDDLRNRQPVVVDNQTEYYTYTNSEGVVLSTTSIFETLWENAIYI